MRLYGLWKFPAMRLLFAVVQGLLCMTVCGLLLAAAAMTGGIIGVNLRITKVLY